MAWLTRNVFCREDRIGQTWSRLYVRQFTKNTCKCGVWCTTSKYYTTVCWKSRTTSAPTTVVSSCCCCWERELRTRDSKAQLRRVLLLAHVDAICLSALFMVDNFSVCCFLGVTLALFGFVFFFHVWQNVVFFWIRYIRWRIFSVFCSTLAYHRPTTLIYFILYIYVYIFLQLLYSSYFHFLEV